MTTDAIQTICNLLQARRELGLKQYGVTVSAEAATDWLTHLLEEQLDSIAYTLAARDRMQLLIDEIAKLKKENRDLETEADNSHWKAVNALRELSDVKADHSYFILKADEKLCDCDNTLRVGSRCSWCASTADMVSVERGRKLLQELEQLRKEANTWKTKYMEADYEGTFVYEANKKVSKELERLRQEVEESRRMMYDAAPLAFDYEGRPDTNLNLLQVTKILTDRVEHLQKLFCEANRTCLDAFMDGWTANNTNREYPQ